MTESPQAWGRRTPLSRSRWWAAFPHGSLDFDVGSVSQWADLGPDRHPWFVALDARAQRAACHGLLDLGARLGFFDELANSNSVSNFTPFVRLIAPYLVRIVRPLFSRETGVLQVTIDRASGLSSHGLTVTAVEHERAGPPRDPAEVPPGRRVEVACEDIAAGPVEVRLHGDVLDTFSVRQGRVGGRFHRSVRSALANLLGEIEPLRSRLIEARGRELQPAVKDLLNLLGLATRPIDGTVANQRGLPEGIGRIDLLSEQPGGPHLLAIECSSEWCGPEKLNKLVGRSRDLFRLLRQQVAPEELSRVLPALAVNKRREMAEKHLLQSARQYGIGIIGLEDMLELLRMAELGEAPRVIGERLAACFPSGSPALSSQLDELGVYESWDEEPG